MAWALSLYLFEQYFVDKATEHLVGEGVCPEQLNDDRLGRVLDKLYAAGLTQLFAPIALKAAEQFGVEDHQSVHLDSTSFAVDGEYAGAQEEQGEPAAIVISRGYSRDHRLDLKQFVVDLMCSGDRDIPLYLDVADGNESDKAVFARLMQQFRAQWQLDVLFVADSALYSQGNLQALWQLQWLSQVPATLVDAQHLLQQTPDE